MSVPRAYHRVRVSEVIAETPDASSLVLSVPPELSAQFTYKPGQFLTVRVPRDGEGAVARCYSLSSSPHTDDPLKITVKRVVDGVASNWICDHVTPGAVLEVLAPAGLFVPRSLDEDVLLFAGGSGITPVISILKSVLAKGDGRIVLIYANRDEHSVIFKDELRRLAAEHEDRLLVTHWYDAVQGPPTAAALRTLIEPYAGYEAFVCGPEAYMALVQQTLGELGVPPHRVHVERFVSLSDDPVAETAEPEGGVGADAAAGTDAPAGRSATVEVELDGQTHRLPWPANRRLLDLLIDAGLNPPFSCRQGICGACACRVTEGKIDLLANEVLEEEDFADGYTLACQAVPGSDNISVTYS